MNLQEHYVAYQTLVKRCMEGFYGRERGKADCILVDKDIWGWAAEDIEGRTLMGTMSRHANEMVSAYQSGDENTYREVSEKHQEVAIKACEAYVQYYIKPWRETFDSTINMDFIAEKGWGWFKFFDKTISAELTVGGKTVDYKIIPRYSNKFCENLEGCFYLDADEVALGKNLTENHFEQVLEYKKRPTPYKFFRTKSGQLTAKAVENFNTPTSVRDWTLNLFPF